MNKSVIRMVQRASKGRGPQVTKVKGPLPKGTKGLMAGPKAPKVRGK